MHSVTPPSSGAELSGVVIRDCDVTNLQIVDSFVHDVSISGDLRNVVVNDVDVTAYVEGELDRQYPERAAVRDAQTPDAHRVLWHVIVAPLGRHDRAGAVTAGGRSLRSGSTASGRSSRRSGTCCSAATHGWAAPCSPRSSPTTRSATPRRGIRRPRRPRSASSSGPARRWTRCWTRGTARAAVVGRVIDELTDEELRRVCAHALRRVPRSAVHRRSVHPGGAP